MRVLWGASLALSLMGVGTDRLPAQERVRESRRLSPAALVRIYSPRGALTVTVGSGDSLTVRGRVDSTLGKFYLVGGPDAVKLGVEPRGGEPEGSADLLIVVPSGVRLWIKSQQADLDLTVSGGTVEATNASGRIRVAGHTDRVSAETLDGNIELVVESPLGRARTASGTIVVRGLIRDLDASTVSGPLLVGMLGPVSRARLETASSEIAFKGDLEPDGTLDAETHSGDVELRLPVRLAASYHLLSYGGALQNSLVPADRLRQGPAKGEWSCSTGDGRATVRVRTFKGQVALKVRGDRDIE
jgi:hypothetical protein